MWKLVTVDDDEPIGSGARRQPFAIMDKDLMLSLARAMPDAQAAVLFCLAWRASVQKRMSRGQHAGQFVSRISGPELAISTGRPIRTVRHALSRLKRLGLIAMENGSAGKKSVYRLNGIQPGQRV